MSIVKKVAMPISTSGSQLAKNMEFTKSGDYRSVYTNNSGIAMSAYDFGLLFGEITDVKDGTAFVEQKIKIMMSPEHTKAFANALMESIKKYEQAFGAIKTPQISDGNISA